MSSYHHFTLEERKYLQFLLEQDKKVCDIARALGRSPSSVSREIRRNRGKKGYHHWRANIQTVVRRRTHRRKILPGTPEWKYIVKRLKRYWSPEQIYHRWELKTGQKPNFSVSLIYRYVKEGLFPNIHKSTHLRRKGKGYRPRNRQYQTIHPDRIIPEWPEEIRRRARIGDWEGDTVYGGIGKGLVVTLVDRRSRYLRAGLLTKRNALLTKNTIVSLLNGLPVHTISLDNGSEFSEFRALEAELDALVYFAEPHKPWQRGTNENTNDILRFFYPKGFDFRTITQDDLDRVVELINNRPRKCLGWRTPAEVFFENSVALA